jgi:hypothetical protein
MTADQDGAAGDAERRASERTEILGDLHGEVMVFQPMTIREISATGAQIETTFPLQLNSLHDLRLELGDAAVVVKGRVAHCRVAEVDGDLVAYRCGLEFVQLSDGVRTVIVRFIEGIRSGRLAR